ncbi:substrate-binding domain-containing protein [Flavimaricola marinus]|uniref:substrate-binding domain-containing protein n=1 Tax=Flavimaricola marinus TaxID=1819565 RepID=UPI0014555D34|nr:substrate-binding domain-containing protein [Flavimaricola marinus]
MFELLVGLSSALSKKGFRFLLHAADSANDVIKAYQDLYRGAGVDGFIVIEPQRSDPRICFLLEGNIPHIVHGKDPAQVHPFVDVDNYQLAYRLTEALVMAGHKRIAFLNGLETRSFAEARAAGYRDALAAANISPRSHFHSFGAQTPDRGHAALRQLMQADQAPTAVIAGNTMIARGIYNAAAELGLSIPGDLSVLAHDDDLSRYPAAGFTPALGGSRSPLANAWQRLADALAGHFSEDDRAAQNYLLEVTYHLDSGSIAGPRDDQA